ncbi:MAG: ImmA/IrrE family metallo-endopeptidase [Planctomycetota bacterium]
MSKDLTEIRVDQYVFNHVPPRYRFSIAHELSHVVLHSEFIQNADFQSVDEWKQYIESGITEKEYSWLEWQADMLAGMMLVPLPELQSRFKEAVRRAESEGLEITPDGPAMAYISSWLGRNVFEVSQLTAEIRIKNESLFHIL